MGKLFIFGIGGTGARVMRSLTFLSAAGAAFQSATVIPILIDTDAQNGDTIRTLRLLDMYETLRKERTGGDFFSTDIQKLSSMQLAGDTQKEQIDKSYLLKFSQANITFADYLGVSRLGPALQDPSRALLEMLYDKSEKNKQSAELNLDMSVGFKGNPNIGALVFNDFRQSAAYKFFEAAFNENDKIIIVGSVFGGTGASGIPVLVNTIRASANPVINVAKIGTVLVLPYFGIQGRNDSAINDQLFNTKAVAALSYYSNHMYSKINAVYYIGDSVKPSPFENNEGGTKQANSAHAVELFAACALSHFDREADNLGAATSFFEFGVKNKNLPLSTSLHFGEQFLRQVIKPMATFMLFTTLLNRTLAANDTFSARKDAGISGNWLGALGGSYALLEEFLNRFSDWLNELANETQTFKPFNNHNWHTADPNTFLMGKELKASLLGFAKIGPKPAELSTAMHELIKANKAKTGTFPVIFESFHKAAEQLMNAHYSNL
ncbi:MAG: hypothetical protein V4543_15640 [Bacteroidota bacterium]